MNKVLNINLGGIAFTIDEDAYQFLEDYLQTLHNHFRASEGYEEIMNDIEARLGELIKEATIVGQIVGIRDVKNAVSVMGTPEDFGASPIDEKPKSTSGIKTGRRLFRDPDDRIVSGVCSGISAYFGIKDPIWLRLAFGLLFFVGGTGVFTYLLLMVLMPKAETTADKLAMRGEAVDVNTIAKAVEEGVDNFSKRMSAFGSPEGQARFNGQVQRVSAQFGDGLGQLLRGLGGVGKVVLTLFIVFVVGIFVLSWVGAVVGMAWIAPLFQYLFQGASFFNWAVINSFFIVLIPTISAVLLIRRILIKKPVKGGWIAGMWGFWFVNVVSLAILGGVFAREFNQHTSFSQKTEWKNQAVETLIIERNNSIFGETHTKFDRLDVSEEQLICRNVHLVIEPSKTNQFELEKILKSNGRNLEEARFLAKNIDYAPVLTDNKLQLAPDFNILNGTKWRGQEVVVVLKVPVGKKIVMERDVAWWAQFETVTLATDADEDKDDCYDAPSSTWVMTADGLRCESR